MVKTDQELLRDYVAGASEGAFRELVERHLGLVYSAARRQVPASDLAEDVAQEVFALLARKAPRLPGKVIVAGWLYRAARQIASEHLRRETRRGRRESMAMTTLEPTADTTWLEIRSDLEHAMASLNRVDHDAVVLRYFENQSLRQVGQVLGLTDDAAQKRLSRALEKLRKYFGQRGKAISASSLAAALAASAVQAPPSALAATICSGAVASAAACGATLSLVQTLTMMKTSLAVGLGAVALMATPLAIQHKTINQLRAENQVLQQQVGQLPTLAVTNGNSSHLDSDERTQARREHEELMRLRGEVGLLRRELASMNASSRSVAQLGARSETAQSEDAAVRARQLSVDTVNVMKNLGLAARIYSTDNSEQFPTNFVQMTNELPAQLPGNLALDGFEFMPQPRAISEREPELILFREKAPRQLPDGRWARAYTFADGSVDEPVTSDGNFDAFEKAHTASGSPPEAVPATTPGMDDALMRRYGLKK